MSALRNTVVEENIIGENAFSDEGERKEFLKKFMGNLEEAEGAALPYLRMAFSYLCPEHGFNTVPLIEFGIAVRRHDPLWKGFSALMYHAGYNVRGKKDGSVDIARDEKRNVEITDFNDFMLDAEGLTVVHLRKVKKLKTEKAESSDKEKAYGKVMSLFDKKRDGEYKIGLELLSESVQAKLMEVERLMEFEMEMDEARASYVVEREVFDHDNAMKALRRRFDTNVMDMIDSEFG